MSLIDKLIQTSTIKETSLLKDSKVFGKKDMISTSVPMINVALSGRIDGGLSPGLTVIAGPSKHFKSSFALLMAQAFQKKYPDGVVLFYDSEFGMPDNYITSFGIDTDRMIHTPILDIEELKFDLVAQLNEIKRGDKVLILIDSVGNLASKKEVEDATNQKSVADMSRAKSLKSLFRIVTPHLTMKDIPMVVVNHTYKTQDLYPKDVVSGGCVVAGTKIQTPDGLKSIEDFNVGEEVITVDGPKIVTHVWNPDTLENGEPECFEVEFEDGYKVICSDKHKFLIDGKWVEARNLRVGQDVSAL